MSITQTIFILFYGVFWGVSLTLIGKYNIFDTHLIRSKKYRQYAICRFILGTLLINILPIIWFLILFYYVVPTTNGWVEMFVSAFLTISIFGFIRILHAFAITIWHNCFYPDKEWNKIKKRIKDNKIEDETLFDFRAHFAPGFLIYFLLIPLFALLILEINKLIQCFV